jgi:hypothetical protein
LWLCEFPQLKNLQTDGRSKLNEAAEQMLADLASRSVKVPPGDGSAADQTSAPSITRPCRDFTQAKQEGL